MTDMFINNAIIEVRDVNILEVMLINFLVLGKHKRVFVWWNGNNLWLEWFAWNWRVNCESWLLSIDEYFLRPIEKVTLIINTFRRLCEVEIKTVLRKRIKQQHFAGVCPLFLIFLMTASLWKAVVPKWMTSF